VTPSSLSQPLLEQKLDSQQFNPGGPASIQLLTTRIQQHTKNTLLDLVDVGLDLISLQRALPKRSYVPWIKKEFGWSRKKAYHFKIVAAWLGDIREIISPMRIMPTAAYNLASASTPKSAREVALQRALSGELITPEVAQQIIDEERQKGQDLRKLVPASKLRARLARILVRYQQRCTPETLPELGQQLCKVGAAWDPRQQK
jgi:hypothetical protein